MKMPQSSPIWAAYPQPRAMERAPSPSSRRPRASSMTWGCQMLTSSFKETTSSPFTSLCSTANTTFPREATSSGSLSWLRKTVKSLSIGLSWFRSSSDSFLRRFKPLSILSTDFYTRSRSRHCLISNLLESQRCSLPANSMNCTHPWSPILFKWPTIRLRRNNCLTWKSKWWSHSILISIVPYPRHFSRATTWPSERLMTSRWSTLLATTSTSVYCRQILWNNPYKWLSSAHWP